MSADGTTIEAAGKSLVLPSGLVPVADYPAVADDAVGYGWEDEGTYAVASIGSMARCESLFVVEDVVAGMRACLERNQGLIAVDAGKTDSGVLYCMTLVKTGFDFGVQYTLSLQLDYADTVASVTVFAEENGMTGVRDGLVLAGCKNQDLVGEDLEGWSIDPFEDHPVDGFPMNLSEIDGLDEHFPTHPLSELRSFARFIVSHN